MKKSLSLVHEQYNMLDVRKFVMAIIVVAIHTRPERSFNSPSLCLLDLNMAFYYF